jgi:hypothetical protein
VIRVPDWVERPLGRYYMYFAHHKGHYIRLAYANDIAGPWTVHEPGTVHVRDTAFFRAQPDPPDSADGFYTHVASPEIYVDNERRQIVMWFHGWWTNGEMWPGGAAARAWANQRGYGQQTQVAESRDGIRFDIKPTITRASYLRVFPFENRFYGMARLGLLLRSDTLLGAFTAGSNPFREGPYAGRVRHVAALRRGTTLHVFFSAIGDAPERIMHTSMSLEGDWGSWRVGPARDVLQPETAYECPTLPNEPSAAGDIEGPARQMRDPAVFEEAGRAWLFYTVCGEQGIAAAELTIG